jgi:hypothetical protein
LPQWVANADFYPTRFDPALLARPWLESAILWGQASNLSVPCPSLEARPAKFLEGWENLVGVDRVEPRSIEANWMNTPTWLAEAQQLWRQEEPLTALAVLEAGLVEMPSCVDRYQLTQPVWVELQIQNAHERKKQTSNWHIF